jgi:hypothetical protein
VHKEDINRLLGPLQQQKNNKIQKKKTTLPQHDM